MFKITSGKGFHITFKNGYTVSVQFGNGNYCENYNFEESDFSFMDYEGRNNRAGKAGSIDAECAVWSKDGDLIAHPKFKGDTVGANMTPEEVLSLLNWASKQRSRDVNHNG